MKWWKKILIGHIIWLFFSIIVFLGAMYDFIVKGLDWQYIIFTIPIFYLFSWLFAGALLAIDFIFKSSYKD